MTCNEVREILDLSFGNDRLPAELLAHLQDCPDCAAFHAELIDLEIEMGDDTVSPFTPSELERAALAVDAKIQPNTTVTVLPHRWMQPMMRVAAAVVLVAASLVAYQAGRHGTTTDTATATATTSQQSEEYGALSTLWASDLEANMDENLISQLIDDYAQDSYWGAGDDLVGDITEEEYQYLMEDFEVGELL